MKPRTLQGRRHLILLVYNHSTETMSSTLYLCLWISPVLQQMQPILWLSPGSAVNFLFRPFKSPFPIKLSSKLLEFSMKVHPHAIHGGLSQCHFKCKLKLSNIWSNLSSNDTWNLQIKRTQQKYHQESVLSVLINELDFVFWRHTADLENGHPNNM